jgi:serine/threonine protein kinase
MNIGLLIMDRACDRVTELTRYDFDRWLELQSDQDLLPSGGPTAYDSNSVNLSRLDRYKAHDKIKRSHSNLKRSTASFWLSGGASDTFQTAPSQPYTFQTAPSRPDQTRTKKAFEQFKLRQLFEDNDLSPPQVWMTNTLQQEESDTIGGVCTTCNKSEAGEMCNQYLEENDWCGLGMHVNFGKEDHIPLEDAHNIIGHGATAMIDIVRCRGIKLARKTILLRRHLGLKEVLKEVRALHELRHAHVIRLVGTYTQGRKFSMLLYPVARLDLAQFLDNFAYSEYLDTKVLTSHLSSHTFWREKLSPSSLCLLSALRYVHSHGIKHMDIKPQNILMTWSTPSTIPDVFEYKMFLCDFGISHIFEDGGVSQTSEYFGRTPKYAAPEVASDQSHGRAADIFSMGCVLAEMNTVFSDSTLEDFTRYRQGGASPCLIDPSIRAPTKPYHETIELSQKWVSQLREMEVSTSTIATMLNKQPARRPRLLADHDILDYSPGMGKDVPSIDPIINLRCSHDSSGPEPYAYDKIDRRTYPDLPGVEQEETKAPKPNDDKDILNW